MMNLQIPFLYVTISHTTYQGNALPLLFLTIKEK